MRREREAVELNKKVKCNKEATRENTLTMLLSEKRCCDEVANVMTVEKIKL